MMPGPLPLARVLIVAPHPDDETIGAAALIQRAVAAGGIVRAVFVTDGDNNPWPLRVSRRKWTVTADDRRAWGTMRREEARAALQHLGATADGASFLGYPDRELAAFAGRGDGRITDALTAIVTAFDPTLVVVPSIQDLHADHRAVAIFAHAAARGRDLVTYVVHGTGAHERVAARLTLTAGERARKLAAIEKHESQLLLSRERFLSYAGEVETFYRAEGDILRPDTWLHTWRCKALHGLRVVMRKGCDED
jgi:LmbE family N-acetylglucosaminyl deacetylase